MVDSPDKISSFKKILAWFGSTRGGAWFMINVVSHIDRWLIRASDGRLNMTFAWPCVLLTTKGVKTGKPRTIPLLYFRDGDNVVIIASKGGNLRHPAWYLNLRADPEVEIFADGKSGRYIARDAVGGERERLWNRALGLYSGYEKYQNRTEGRQIPVVVLEPKLA